MRKIVAREVLEHADLGKLDNTTAKVVKLFRSELKYCAEHGVLSMCLFAILRMLVISWKGDTQEIEGINSLIDIIVKSARGCHEALLDARVGCRKDVGSHQHYNYEQSILLSL